MLAPVAAPSAAPWGRVRRPDFPMFWDVLRTRPTPVNRRARSDARGVDAQYSPVVDNVVRGLIRYEQLVAAYRQPCGRVEGYRVAGPAGDPSEHLAEGIEDDDGVGAEE